MRRRAALLVIQHDADKGLGLLERPLLDAGLALDVRLAGRDRLALDGHVGVVALPGLADPVDDTEAVVGTREALADALDRGLPALGVCLGAELLAEAAGGTTRPCPPEYGYCRVSLTAAAESDPLLSGLPSELSVFQAHGFAVELPAEAVTLAESPHAIQAFRLGERGWGIQFHPEPTPSMLASWLATIRPRIEECGLEPAAVAAEAESTASVSAERAYGIGSGFAAAVGAVRDA